jgi:hypothetical protein
MISDLRNYARAQQHMQQWLRENNYMNFLTDAFGSFQWRDWRACGGKTDTGNIVGNMLNKLIFGG